MHTGQYWGGVAGPGWGLGGGVGKGLARVGGHPQVCLPCRAGAHQPFHTPYCVCKMSCGNSSYRRKKPMEPKATPHRAACKRWGVVGGAQRDCGLSETRVVCTDRRRVEGGGGGELEPAMGPSRRRRGVRGLMCVHARFGAVCSKESEMLRGRGLPGPRHARGARSPSLGASTHRNAELQDGLESRHAKATALGQV